MKEGKTARYRERWGVARTSSRNHLFYG